MSIEELTDLQATFSSHLQNIKINSQSLPKCQRLRITAWLKKLCSVVDNVFWRRNRNLYAEVLSLMLSQGLLQTPFDKSPPEGSLAKLNIYEIPFQIRKQLTCEKKVGEKQNHQPNFMGRKSTQCRQRKKLSHKLESMKSFPQPTSEIEFEIQTRRQLRGVNKEQKLVETLEASLHFLAKNHPILGQYNEYREILQETVSVADELGHDFRQMKFSVLYSE